MRLDREPLVVVVLGPTASGKTALALAIARRFHGEIVNCDSVAMYREFEIGTAKPSAAERAEIPHHLLGLRGSARRRERGRICPPGPAGSARDSCVKSSARERAAQTLAHRQRRNRTLSARSAGRTFSWSRSAPKSCATNSAAAPRSTGPEHLHRILRRLDAAAASRIHANDVPKVIRAIEVCLASRQPSRRTMTELWRQGREPLRGFRILRLGLNPEREALYARINQRAAKMFDEGLIAETERLLTKYGDQARPLKSLGYKQAVQFLRGEVDRESALAAAQQAHRNYAKRQITWFRREPDVHWLAGFGDDPAIQAEGIAIVERQI